MPAELNHEPRRSGATPGPPEPAAVAFATLADVLASLAEAERECSLRERPRFLAHASLLVGDEIGYLSILPCGGNPMGWPPHWRAARATYPLAVT